MAPGRPNASHAGVGLSVGGTGDGAGVVASAAHLFAEHPSRVVACVAADQVAAVLAQAESAGVPAVELGSAGGDRVVIGGGSSPLVDIDLAELTAAWRNRLPDALGAGTTQA